MENHRRREEREWEKGEAWEVKVILDNVRRAKEKDGCQRNCLRDVDEKHILDQWYMAWDQKFETRATWIFQMLNSFHIRTEGICRDKYKMKFNSKEVYNAYYATALGRLHTTVT